MRILLQQADNDTAPWVRAFAELLPEARVEVWHEGQEAHVQYEARAVDEKDARRAARPCDYAVVWSPPRSMLAELAEVKAIFNCGAGVDALLKVGAALPARVPIVRLGDAGMGVQMAEYVLHAVLRHVRRFDEYESLAREGRWQPLTARRREDCAIGVLGAGVLGKRVLAALAPFGFPLLAWSRGQQQIDGVRCFAGPEGLDAVLRASQILVCMLPLTPETANLLDRANLAKLPPQAYLINVARGALLSEPDLLAMIESGRLAGATLDVFRNEPLPVQHPFWRERRIIITPHIAARTVCRDSVAQIAAKIRQLRAGQPVADVVDRNQGY
ncbi:MAG: glyoxylate/hydroxypyruvate reductase A [Pseudomonadota bacterium]